MNERGVAVVAVTRNTREQVRVLLDGLADDPHHVISEIVVVDNDSSDGTAELVATHPLGPRYIRNTPGRGFAAAVNQGAAATSAPTIAILPAATRLTVDAARRLEDALLSADDIAGVGPLVRNLDGTVQRHGLFAPRPLTALVVLLGLGDLGPFRAEAERYYGPHRPGPAIAVDNLSGACLVVRRSAWERTGGFDERFFLYAEDVDWSLRAREAGFRLLFVPQVEVRREKSATSRADPSGSIRLYYRSLRAFYRKHHGRDPAPIRALWLGGAYVREALELARAKLAGGGLRY